MKRALTLFLAIASSWLSPAAQAHIGSSAVVFDGAAGPYSVRVIILPPPVIPGRAEINIRMLKDETEPVKMTVLPVNAQAGLTGAPPPDEALAVPGEPALHHSKLWLMSSGSYSVQVTVEGAQGRGTVIVPVVAVATQRLAMPMGLGILLFSLGLVLVVGAAALAGTGVRNSVLAPGEPLNATQKRKGRVAVSAAFVVLAASLYGGKRRWDAVDFNYRHNEIYRATPLDATVSRSEQTRVLHLSAGRDGTYSIDRLKLIPDHGKLMHLFMIREPQLDVLAHLHPIRSGARSFELSLPPLPDGVYRLYSDITYETGFAATLTTTVTLQAHPDAISSSPPPAVDPDDSWDIANATSTVSPGPRVTLTHEINARAGEDVSLDFALVDETGQPVEIEPYMGMLGHAAVRRSDGSVFAHLHPVGTISMAAQEFFAENNARELKTTVPADHHEHHHHHVGAGNVVSFPYLFPQAGAYRVWVQTKVAGRVVTGVFDLAVK